MTPFRTASIRRSLLLACALLVGCSGMPLDRPDGTNQANRARALREKEMQSAWAGQSYEALIKVFGAPGMIMNIPAYRGWKASVLVYQGLDAASGCIDAFAVAHSGKPEVYDYFCR